MAAARAFWLRLGSDFLAVDKDGYLTVHRCESAGARSSGGLPAGSLLDSRPSEQRVGGVDVEPTQFEEEQYRGENLLKIVSGTWRGYYLAAERRTHVRVAAYLWLALPSWRTWRFGSEGAAHESCEPPTHDAANEESQQLGLWCGKVGSLKPIQIVHGVVSVDAAAAQSNPDAPVENAGALEVGASPSQGTIDGRPDEASLRFVLCDVTEKMQSLVRCGPAAVQRQPVTTPSFWPVSPSMRRTSSSNVSQREAGAAALSERCISDISDEGDPTSSDEDALSYDSAFEDSPPKNPIFRRSRELRRQSGFWGPHTATNVADLSGQVDNDQEIGGGGSDTTDYAGDSESTDDSGINDFGSDFDDGFDAQSSETRKGSANAATQATDPGSISGESANCPRESRDAASAQGGKVGNGDGDESSRELDAEPRPETRRVVSLTKKLARRQLVVREIMTTESAYLRALDVLLDCYLMPLKSRAEVRWWYKNSVQLNSMKKRDLGP